VSSRHAQIVKMGDQLLLEDLRSANGTFVRGQRLPPGQRVPVANGEKVFIGPMPLLIHITGSPERNLPLPGFKQMVGGLLAAFPDFRITVEDQFIAGDKVATRWTAEGTHTRPLGEVPSTGKRMRVEGLIMDRVVGDRVVERWEQWDQMAMLQQLGLMG